MSVVVHEVWRSKDHRPAFEVPGLVQMLTFRLLDSIPTPKFRALQPELNRLSELERRKLIERHIDAGYGECLLRRPELADLMEDTLLHFDGERYWLLAWVVMPNHVHVLIEMKEGHPLPKLYQSWKGFSANQINKLLGRTGSVWLPESFDRGVRDEEHLQAAITYIHLNPVKAGLCDAPEEWRWSSAWSGR
jgi:REP element-mobilizing transposase RayT